MNSKYLKQFGVLLFLLLVMPVWWFFYGHAKLFDDNYIYLQYAKHFWENHELSFNLGEISYAFTSPLWQILYILLYPVLPYYIIPVLLSTIFSISTILFCWFILKDIFKDRVTLIFAMLIISFDPILMKHAFNGMETSLAGFLAYVVILGVVVSGKIRNSYLSGLIFGIFLLVRPESGVLIFLTLLYLLITKQKNYKETGKIVLTTVIILLPWILFAHFYFGRILPDTYGAKGGDYPLGSLFFRNVFDSIKVLGGNYLPLFLLALFYLKRIIPFIYSKLYINYYLVLTAIGYIIVYSLIISHETFYARYMVLFTPALLIFLIRFFNYSIEGRKRFIISLTISIVLILSMTFILSRLDKGIVDIERTAETQVTTWVMKNTDDDSYIYRHRIGEIGFITQRRIFDPIGLINRDISEYYQTGRIVEYYKMKKPDYFIGPDEVLMAALNKAASFDLQDKILVTKRYLVRDMLASGSLGQSNTDTLKIYKATWFK